MKRFIYSLFREVCLPYVLFAFQVLHLKGFSLVSGIKLL